MYPREPDHAHERKSLLQLLQDHEGNRAIQRLIRIRLLILAGEQPRKDDAEHPPSRLGQLGIESNEDATHAHHELIRFKESLNPSQPTNGEGSHENHE